MDQRRSFQAVIKQHRKSVMVMGVGIVIIILHHIVHDTGGLDNMLPLIQQTFK